MGMDGVESEKGGIRTGQGSDEELGADTMVDIAGLLLVHHPSTIQYIVCSFGSADSNATDTLR
jgi:hypothetical protein